MMSINANVDARVLPPVGCHGRPPGGVMAKQQRTTEADAPVAPDDPATCTTSGGITSRRLSPDGFSIWLSVSQLESGASLEWGTDHGDEAVYVIDGTLHVTGDNVEAGECPAGGAMLVESGVAARAVAQGAAKIAHFGSTNPVPQKRGEVAHVIGPRGRYESPPDRPFFRFFADSTCATCDAFLLFSQRDHGWSVTPHSHSADELIYVLSGGVRTGSQVNSTGTCLAFPANVKYALAAEESGFETINFRARRSELKFVDGEGSMEETAANVGGVEVVAGESGT
jgi:quercetin dioxygenase-like cupin family protein